MMSKDYYKILGLERNASPEHIKKAYRKLAMQYHPDRNHGKEEWANTKFKEINEAFSILGDSKKRKQYDQFGTAENIGDIFSSQATRSTFEDLMNDFGGAGLGFDFLDDIFGDILSGRGFSFRTYGSGFSSPGGVRLGTRQGINFKDLFCQTQRPKEKSVKYEIVLTQEQAAKGIYKDLIRYDKKLKVKIPAGVRAGSNVRLRNALKITDGQPGDIIIHIKVK